jgi:hypothetical protein
MQTGAASVWQRGFFYVAQCGKNKQAAEKSNKNIWPVIVEMVRGFRKV